MDPLLHLVRNAISHSIESAAERVAAGKAPAGVIALRARTDGQTIVIEVEDDGRGIDCHEVLSRARKLGLSTASDRPEDVDVLDILCAPGFSTRDSVDRTSGRGVGMNVVQSTVEELGGRISLWTHQGKGTRFTIRLPLTLSITDALIFDVGNQTFALAQSTVQEVFEFEPSAVSILENNEMVVRRGRALPLLRLAALFGLSALPSPRHYALIVGEGRGAAGLVVDRLLGLHEIVVRPLVDPLVRVRGISGVTELGDGRVALILDPAGVLRDAPRVRAQTSTEAGSISGAPLAATS
jgi:two-component system chemotaxis sensor kinase CheA